MKGMRVLVCGDRNWSDKDKIKERLSLFPVDTIIIQGGAQGADRLAAEAATEVGMAQEEFRANWRVQGRAAGPIRNQRMLEEGRPDLVLAFHKRLESSRGTADMVRRARKAGIPVDIIA